MTDGPRIDPAFVNVLDLEDRGFLTDPYPALARLREATPVGYDEQLGMWWITRFDGVQAMLRDSRLGRIYRHRYDDEAFGQTPPTESWPAFAEHERWSLFNLEPPTHTDLRRLIAKVFTPQAVRDLTGDVQIMSDRLLDEVTEQTCFDLIGDYAEPFSTAVICSMLGVPAEAGPRVLQWSHDIVKMFEPAASLVQRERAELAAGAFADYVRSLIADKRQRPDDRLVSRLVHVADGGERLTEGQVVSTTMVLLEAGHEATVKSIGNGVAALASHPGQYQALVCDEADHQTAVEEMLRFDPATQLFTRWVLEPGVEIGGHTLPVGALVGCLFGSAQRDPQRFQSPDRFDIARTDTAGHLAFGAGIHHCLGAHLARLELITALHGLTARLPVLTIEETPHIEPTFVMRGRSAVILAGRS